MTPYFNSRPIGHEQFASAMAMPAVAERMFADGADEVRIRPVRSDRRATKRQEPKRVKRAKRKAQKRARRAQRR